MSALKRFRGGLGLRSNGSGVMGGCSGVVLVRRDVFLLLSWSGRYYDSGTRRFEREIVVGVDEIGTLGADNVWKRAPWQRPSWRGFFVPVTPKSPCTMTTNW